MSAARDQLRSPLQTTKAGAGGVTGPLKKTEGTWLPEPRSKPIRACARRPRWPSHDKPIRSPFGTIRFPFPELPDFTPEASAASALLSNPMNGLRSLLFPLAATLVTPAAFAQGHLAHDHSTHDHAAHTHAVDRAPMSRIERDTAAALNLLHVDVVNLDLEGAPGHSTSVVIPVDGAAHRLMLEPHSNRAADFQVLEDRGDGKLVAVEPALLTTYRGELLDQPGSSVAAGWQEDGLHAQIELPDGSRLWMEPVGLEIEGATERSYALYSDSDVRPMPHACGVDDSFAKEFASLNGSTGNERDMPAVAFGSALLVAELAFDADFEYFQDYGSTQAVQSRIETVMNVINQQYEGDVGITHEITTILVRTNSNNPYTSNNAGTLLTQFRNEWNQNQTSIQRDVAHLFTGKNLQAPTIGVAFLGTICNNFSAYGLSESDCCFGFATTTDLTAHELGHNWSADHCSCGAPSFTMNASLTGANRFSPTQTIPQITNFAATRPCLDQGSTSNPPPAVLNFSPASVEVVNPTSSSTVTLQGIGFEGITGVLVNGVPATSVPPQFAIINDFLMTVNLTAPLTVGTTTIELQQGADSVEVDIPVGFNDEPAIDLNGIGNVLFSAVPIEVEMGGQPGDLHFLLLSLTLQPSSIPGLLDIGIGANLTDLFLLGTFPVNPTTGSANFSVSIAGAVSPGTTLYFQSVVLSTSQPFGPLISSNIELGTVLF